MGFCILLAFFKKKKKTSLRINIITALKSFPAYSNICVLVCLCGIEVCLCGYVLEVLVALHLYSFDFAMQNKLTNYL